ncbi:ABC transporter ATP-binding protein [Deinococcus cellulosilyticus]|uniref:ABC transporter ATP-binding protein n=1 Tax=Deinococcus cellulosilyticus (strain DSM 18568 / NBRC 106333 / KACC 11606 / 5516J-15) TaxID=1223518 RepID=A0A511MYT8_DEIC1|nr:ABC transporter ATP-binding protein [Deinococcus cellulosilyticus]GEM45760.1 ABC transporter ATP-binding protein [Deinococcus cellulosilyticus NBRC 106333 = KACC 11606]
MQRYLNILGQYLSPLKGKVAVLLLAMLAGIGLQLWIPQITRNFIDAATQKGPEGTLIQLAVMFLVFALLNQGFSTLSTYLSADIGWTTTNALRVDLFRRVMRLDMRFHKDRTPGELIERIDGDVTSISNFFSQFVVRVTSSALLAVGILALLWREDWRVGLIITAYVVVIFFVLQKRAEVAVPATRLEREASASMFGFIEERLAGLDDIRANGAGRYTMNRMHHVAKDWLNKNLKSWYMRSTIWTSMMVLFSLGYCLTLGVGVYFFQQGLITLGTVYLFFNYMRMLEAPLDEITRQMQEFQKASAGILRVEELQNEKIDIEDNGTQHLPQGALSVNFDNLTFAYGDHLVLKGLNFDLKPGEVLGLLGRTGSGKSTLVRLLFRLYDPTSGTLKLGGLDSREVPLKELRQKVGMVTQDVQLFHASIRENLTFFDPSIPDSRIHAVLKELAMDSWVDALPEGLDTKLQANGAGLSAGESQLLAFARVFLQDPGLVILDEPSSRLDPATERHLNQAIGRLLKGRTGIIIAHRLDTVERADKIMVLSQGEILEFGEREALKQDRSSRYSQMLRVSRADNLEEELEKLGV